MKKLFAQAINIATASIIACINLVFVTILVKVLFRFASRIFQIDIPTPSIEAVVLFLIFFVVCISAQYIDNKLQKIIDLQSRPNESE